MKAKWLSWCAGIVVLAWGMVLMTQAGWAEVEIHETYYESGALKAIFPVQKGKLEGVTQWYYESGALGALLEYRENELHGLSKTFYENGVLKKVVKMVHNKPFGEVTHYGPDGSILRKEKFLAGKRIAQWTFDETGQVALCEDAL